MKRIFYLILFLVLPVLKAGAITADSLFLEFRAQPNVFQTVTSGTEIQMPLLKMAEGLSPESRSRLAGKISALLNLRTLEIQNFDSCNQVVKKAFLQETQHFPSPKYQLILRRDNLRAYARKSGKYIGEFLVFMFTPHLQMALLKGTFQRKDFDVLMNEVGGR